MFREFKDATLKDQKNKKETFTNRISYLKTLKEDMMKSPKHFNNISMTTDQLQNLIDDWSSPKPLDAFYKRVFGLSYVEKKQQEEKELENDKKRETKKTTEETQSIH